MAKPADLDAWPRLSMMSPEAKEVSKPKKCSATQTSAPPRTQDARCHRAEADTAPREEKQRINAACNPLICAVAGQPNDFPIRRAARSSRLTAPRRTRAKAIAIPSAASSRAWPVAELTL